MKRLYFFAMLLMVLSFSLSAQVARGLDNADMTLLRQEQRVNHSFDERHVTYGFTPGRRTWNPFYHLLSAPMYVYQSVVSPLLSTRCAYSPSCSAYSKALIREYGLLKGSLLTADRLMRCNRIALADLNNKYKFLESQGNIIEDVDRYK